MALITEALIDYTYLKTQLNINSDTKQELYEELINSASLIANQITKRKLKASDKTIILDGNGSNILILKEYPVNSVSELYIDEERVFPITTLINPLEYGIYLEEGIIKLWNTVFPDKPQTIKVVCNSGFTIIPNDIKHAVVEIVSFLYRRLNSKTIGQKTVSSNNGITENWETSIPLNALDILLKYKR